MCCLILGPSATAMVSTSKCEKGHSYKMCHRSAKTHRRRPPLAPVLRQNVSITDYAGRLFICLSLPSSATAIVTDNRHMMCEIFRPMAQVVYEPRACQSSAGAETVSQSRACRERFQRAGWSRFGTLVTRPRLGRDTLGTRFRQNWS